MLSVPAEPIVEVRSTAQALEAEDQLIDVATSFLAGNRLGKAVSRLTAVEKQRAEASYVFSRNA